MRKKFILSIIAIFALAMGFFVPSQVANADSNVSKTYVYEIGYDNGYMATSKYSNNSDYSFSASRVEDLIYKIDEDRYNLGTYASCTLVFEHMTIGDDFVSLKNGSYLIKGSITANALNTKGVFSLDGGEVVFEDVVLVNKGFSPLIKNTGAGDIEIRSGFFNADSNVIVSTSDSTGDIDILGGTITSATGFAIQVVSTNQVDVTISGANTKISSAQTATIKADKANISISGGEIANTANGACVEVGENSSLNFTGEPVFSGDVHIKTKNAVNVQDYNGSELKILYNKDISNGEIAVIGIDQNNKDKFVLANEDYRFKTVGNSLTLNKILHVNYLANGVELTQSMQEQMNTEYFVGDLLEVEFFAGDVKDGYVFTGFALNENGVATILAPYSHTFIEEDLFLYAVFEAKTYNITYELGALDVDNSANASNQTYTTGVGAVINEPTRLYYDFVGWTVDGGQEIFSSYVILENYFGDITLSAVWQLHEYQINYIGIDNLNTSNLKTKFTIKDEPLSIDYSNFFGNGYSLYHLALDENYLNILQDGDKLYFDTISRPNPDVINIYIKAVDFHNGEGNGTKNSPYVIETAEQFGALLEGQKSGNVQHIKLNNDIEVLDVFDTQKPLENIIFDGNDKTIYFMYINSINNFAGLIPSIKNCQFSNVNFVASNFYDGVIFDETKYIGLVFGNINNSILNDISLVFEEELTVQSQSETGMMYISAFAGRAENSSVLNNIKIKGSPLFDIWANGDLNLYFGTICAAVYNSLIINSQIDFQANFNVDLYKENAQAIIFTSGLANLWRDAKIYNSISQGVIFAKSFEFSRVISSAIANAFAEGATVKNTFAVYKNRLPQNQAITKVDTTWSSLNSNLTSENILAFAKGNADLKNGTFLKTFNSKISAFNKELKDIGYDVELKPLYHSDTIPNFEQSVLVHYKGLGVIADKTILYQNQTNLTKAFLPYTGDHFFNGWYLDKNFNKKAKLSNLDGTAEITLYAKFTPIKNVANGYFAIYVVIGILLLAGLIVAMYFFDKKKPVKFYSNGKLIAEKSYKRLEEIELPEGYENTLWFVDIQGQTPFINRRMPHKSISLYTFNESKQKRMENKYYQKLKEENELKETQEKLRMAAEEKQKQEREEKRLENLRLQQKKAEQRKQLLEERRKQKQAQAEAKQKEKLEAEAQKAKLEAERKAAEEKRRAQKEVDIDGKITVVKKEIKVIKPKKDE